MYPNPAAIACQLYTLPDHDELSVASPTDTPGQFLPDQTPMAAMYSDPPMNSLPYPPPTAASPPYFQSPTPDGAWEEIPARLTVPSQSYMLGQTAFSPSLPQQYTPPSGTRSQRRHSRSPSPSAPHTKRSMDKKPALACLFCRGRKIACGPPQPGSKDKTCK